MPHYNFMQYFEMYLPRRFPSDHGCMVQRMKETPAETIPGESKETSSDSSRSEVPRVQQVTQTRRCTTSEESKAPSLIAAVLETILIRICTHKRCTISGASDHRPSKCPCNSKLMIALAGRTLQIKPECF